MGGGVGGEGGEEALLRGTATAGGVHGAGLLTTEHVLEHEALPHGSV